MNKYINKIFTVVVISVAIVFVTDKLNLLSNISNDIYGQNKSTEKIVPVSENENAEVQGYIEDGVQVIEFDLEDDCYPSINIREDMPVKLIINVSKDSLNSCNYKMVSQDFLFQKQLDIGKNTIEFTPTESGQYTYTCWMGMLGGYINVVDEDIIPSAYYDDNFSAGGCCLVS